MELVTMLSRLNFLWRLGVTGACFAFFTVGGMVVSATVFPVMRLMPGGKTVRTVRVQAMVRRFFGGLITVLQRAGVMRLEVQGAERLRVCGGTLVLANHPTYIDVVVLLSLMPRASCVVKGSLWRNWFFGGIVREAGYISNSDGERLVEDCVAALKSTRPLLVFPEGTRTDAAKPLKFMRGAAYVALQSGCPILPVVLTCHPPTLCKGMKWYQIPREPFVFRVEVREPMNAADLAGVTDCGPIAARRVTERLEEYFTCAARRYG